MSYDYNSSRNRLKLPEYGRNIQKMVEFLMTVEDRDKRNKLAYAVISVMGNMNPHLRDISDFKHKLWDHLSIMSEFKLDIDSPYKKPEPKVFNEKPKSIGYKANEIKYKHYGRTLEILIDAASKYPEGEEKEQLIKVIANHMKKSYLTWNREVVNDGEIFKDLRELSGGKLSIGEDIKLNDTREILSKNKRKRITRKK
ncbi:MAG: DUF4290 domain-containing protein [Bacteroidales bacterium]|nr:MAG: DUF4290 domain-containing protein [Bacteroidales bacterium]